MDEWAKGLIIFIALLAGLSIGRGSMSEACAEQAISVKPAKWWTDALIDARARAEKRRGA